jgi:hypothetical protein
MICNAGVDDMHAWRDDMQGRALMIYNAGVDEM